MVACGADGTGMIVFTVEAGATTGENHTLFISPEMGNATKMPWDYARERQLKRLEGRASYRGFLDGLNRRSREGRWRG